MHRFSLCWTGSAHLRGLRYAHASGQNRIKGREDSHFDRSFDTVHVVKDWVLGNRSEREVVIP